MTTWTARDIFSDKPDWELGQAPFRTQDDVDRALRDVRAMLDGMPQEWRPSEERLRTKLGLFYSHWLSRNHPC